MRFAVASRLVLFFGFEGLGDEFAIGFLEQNFNAAFGFLELFLAFAGELNAFFEEFHGIVESELGALEAADDFLEASEGLLEVGFPGRLGFFYGS
jgi:hypothetical protein